MRKQNSGQSYTARPPTSIKKELRRPVSCSPEGSRARPPPALSRDSWPPWATFSESGTQPSFPRAEACHRGRRHRTGTDRRPKEPQAARLHAPRCPPTHPVVVLGTAPRMIRPEQNLLCHQPFPFSPKSCSNRNNLEDTPSLESLMWLFFVSFSLLNNHHTLEVVRVSLASHRSFGIRTFLPP